MIWHQFAEDLGENSPRPNGQSLLSVERPLLLEHLLDLKPSTLFPQVVVIQATETEWVEAFDLYFPSTIAQTPLMPYQYYRDWLCFLRRSSKASIVEFKAGMQKVFNCLSWIPHTGSELWSLNYPKSGTGVPIILLNPNPHL
jgi:hypothetical protein